MTNQKRLDRERKTIQLMFGIYYRENHHTAGELCENCRQLESYAMSGPALCGRPDQPEEKITSGWAGRLVCGLEGGR
ncbi:MAG TPA: nitrous oxide-stimulated promoter family protein [Anaerolineaceae bacterium]|nr:nitrous oxide-stimulated promoter family protein [Anaerolineaceae bacterium]